jgi:hypothetical protein
MAKETLLQKEFQKRDVQRIRNLLSGKQGDATQTQVGYTSKYISRSEGDVWEEFGRKWTIKNGIKMSVTKLDRAKKLSLTPLLCPKCDKLMKTEYDKKMFRIHSTCFDCVIKMETQLKIEGKYQEYEDKIIKANANFMLDEFVSGFDSFLDSIDSNNGFVTEQGDIEDWHVKALDKQKIREQVMKDVEESRAKLNS